LPCNIYINSPIYTQNTAEPSLEGLAARYCDTRHGLAAAARMAADADAERLALLALFEDAQAAGAVV